MSLWRRTTPPPAPHHLHLFVTVVTDQKNIVFWHVVPLAPYLLGLCGGGSIASHAIRPASILKHIAVLPHRAAVHFPVLRAV